MTSSQWLDIAVLAVALVAAVSGWRSGALGSLMSFVGVILGAIAGVMLAPPHIVSHISSPRAKLFAALFLILALVVVGEVAGVVLGRAVRGAIRNRAVRTVDSVIGVAVQLLVVMVAAWLLASPLTSSDQPNLAAATRGSKVLAEVDKYAPECSRRCPSGCRRCCAPPVCRMSCSPSAALPFRPWTPPPTHRWPTAWSSAMHVPA